MWGFPKAETKVYQEGKAAFYHPVRRMFMDLGTKRRTSMVLEKIYWDLLDAMAARVELSWGEVLQHLLSAVGRDRRSKCSYIRCALAQDLVIRLQLTQGK